MNFTQYRDALFEAALSAGCQAAEVCFTDGEDFEARVLDGALDSYSVSRSAGLGLRVLLAGKKRLRLHRTLRGRGRARWPRHGQRPRPSSRRTTTRCRGRRPILPSLRPPEPLVGMDERAKIELCREMERLTKAEDPRVQQVAYNIVSSGRGTVRIHNTLGLRAERPLAAGASLVVAVLRDGAEVRDGSGYRLGAQSADVGACAKGPCARQRRSWAPRASRRGLPRAAANDAAASLLEAFSPMLSADRAQKGLSPLAGREGQRLASLCVTLTDDPLYEKRPRAFDDEGTPSVTKNVIENGMLITLLHNLKTAKKAGTASTSNGARASAGSPVGVSPSNLYFVPGTEDFGALLITTGQRSCRHRVRRAPRGRQRRHGRLFARGQGPPCGKRPDRPAGGPDHGRGGFPLVALERGGGGKRPPVLLPLRLLGREPEPSHPQTHGFRRVRGYPLPGESADSKASGTCPGCFTYFPNFT